MDLEDHTAKKRIVGGEQNTPCFIAYNTTLTCGVVALRPNSHLFGMLQVVQLLFAPEG